MSRSVQWAAELAHVRVVSLLGSADLAFWKERLIPEGLLPAESDGQAQVSVIACDSKYRGVRFRELSIALVVAGLPRGTRQDAAYRRT